MAIICFFLLEVNNDRGEEFAAGLFFSICLWFIFIPIACFEERAHFCKFFNLPHFEFRSPITIKETEE